MRNRNDEYGSALVMAVFVLFLLTSVGAGLLFLTNTEIRSSRATVRGQQSYYVSEAALEDGRTELFERNRNSVDPTLLTEELLGVAGANGVFDFDPDNVRPVYDGAGRITGFTGIGDDRPIATDIDFFGTGERYFAFVTNDPDDGTVSPVDTNQMAMVYGIGSGPDRTLEFVEALVFRPDAYPDLPATITILGPDAVFEGGNSAAKFYTGDEGGHNCLGGDLNVHVPVVGVIGPDSEASAEDGVDKPETYTSDGATGNDTVDDLTDDPNANPLWTDCEGLIDLARNIKFGADVVGDSNTPRAALGTPGNPKSVFIEGDYDISGNWDGEGLLFVTGQLTIDGKSGWQGPIFVIGKGDFLRDGAGNGDITGGIVVADVAGPDRILFTDDDCSGEDGVQNTADDGIANSTYIVNGSGNSTTGYCGNLFPNWQGMHPFAIVSFRQR